jgi:fatty acid desaturase
MFMHLLRLGAPLVALAVFRESAVAGVVFGFAAYLAAFALSHDLAHGALRFPRRVNEWLLSLSALPMLVSGHSMRLMHLRHHARPLASDDLEGAGAATTLLGAIGLGPKNAWALRVEAWRSANRRERTFIAFELVAAAALAAFMMGWPAGQAWAAMCVVLALTASAWASHLPHHPPALMKRVAVAFAWTGSAVLLSFAFHDEHHQRPKVPCADLAAVR